ncbi:MAG: outer membrane beta-barrel protein, partial [Bacteroidota bacterium]
AQSDKYLKGFIVNTTQDTIYGFIQDENRTKIAERISFKANLKEVATTYTPENIIAFYLEPSFYFETVRTTVDGQEKMLFLRKLVDGYIDLYQFFDGKYLDYVLIKDSGEQIQLTKRDNLREGNYSLDKRYTGQLRYFFRDCPKIAKDQQPIAYSTQAIKKLIRFYEQCTVQSEISQSLDKTRKLRMKIGPSVGVNYYDISLFTAGDFLRTSENDMIPYYGLVLSFYYFEDLSFQSGLFYHQYQTIYRERPYSFGVFMKSYDLHTLEIPILLKYELKRNSLLPYLTTGLRVVLPLQSDAREIKTRLEVIETDRTFDVSYNGIYGYVLGVGKTIRISDKIDLNLDLYYSNSDAFSETDADLTIKSFLLQCSLMF